MYGIAPKLPFAKDSEGKFMNTQTIMENTQQNLKNVILTCPGERIMMPDFGVGLRNYLFRNATSRTESELGSRIRTQVGRYLPFVEISDLFIDTGVANVLSLRLTYSVSGLTTEEELFLSVASNL